MPKIASYIFKPILILEKDSLLKVLLFLFQQVLFQNCNEIKAPCNKLSMWKDTGWNKQSSIISRILTIQSYKLFKLGQLLVLWELVTRYTNSYLQGINYKSTSKYIARYTITITMTSRNCSSDSRFIGQLDERLQNEFTKNLFQVIKSVQT